MLAVRGTGMPGALVKGPMQAGGPCLPLVVFREEKNVFAHALEGQPIGEWEPLSDHLAAVSLQAAAFAAVFGWAEAGRAAGMLHDIGKCSAAFQAYISTPKNEAAGGRRGPDHSTAGARAATELYPGLLGRLLAFAIAGHHAGLADAKELDQRLDREYKIQPYGGWQVHSGIPAAAAVLTPTRKPRPASHQGFTVAPSAGAWIETWPDPSAPPSPAIAPLTSSDRLAVRTSSRTAFAERARLPGKKIQQLRHLLPWQCRVMADPRHLAIRGEPEGKVIVPGRWVDVRAGASARRSISAKMRPSRVLSG